MSGIEGVGWPTRPRIGSRAQSTASAGFALPSDGPAASDRASAAAAPSPVALASMLTLQELGGETLQDRAARRHGQDMLAALAALQRALLAGDEDCTALQRLAALAAEVPLATDRRLAAMLSAIVVRVRVELARRQRR